MPDGAVRRPMQQFTYDVSAEEIAGGGQFTRRLLLGPFHPTSEVDYCDPTADDDQHVWAWYPWMVIMSASA